MSHVYITDSGFKLGIRQGQLVVSNSEGEPLRTVPITAVSDISIFGMPQISTQLIRECLTRGISICYYSDDGHYYGNICGVTSHDPFRQKQQMRLTDNAEFCLAWSKRIILTKILNSIALLRSMPERYAFTQEELAGLLHSLQYVQTADSVNAALGFEGNAAKNYFACLPKLLSNERFEFHGRSTRPPKDAFNSMISFGYSLLYRDIIGAIERRGLNPYFAFMHRLKIGHAALASDLLEEYRAPIVDKTVIELINSGEVDLDGFYVNESGAVYMTRDASSDLAKRISRILARDDKYFMGFGDNRSYGFQAMLDRKLDLLIKAIEAGDASLYQPYVWNPR